MFRRTGGSFRIESCCPLDSVSPDRSVSSGIGRPTRRTGQYGALLVARSRRSRSPHYPWGPWQAKLSRDPLGPASPYLARILSTHWMRTALTNAYGFTLLVWAIESLARR